MNADLFPELGSVRPSDVRDYMRLRGWRQVDVRRNEVAFYTQKSAEGEVRAKLLLDTSFSDYMLRTAELVDVLSKVERRPFQQILTDLLSPPGDCVRFRLDSESTRSGSIPVEQSLRFRHGMRQALLSCAHSALKPQKHFARLSQKEALDLLNRTRELPTERGSYVAALLIPIPPPVGQTALVTEDYGRRVTSTLAAAVRETARIVTSGDPEELVTHPEKGMSSNFLEALAEMEPAGELSAVEVTMSWLGPAPTTDVGGVVRLNQGGFRYFAQAAKELRETTPLPGVEVEGYVVRLEREPPAGAEPVPGAIVVATDLDGFGPAKVSVLLQGGDYQKATEAHRDGQRVRLLGTITKTGRTLQLLEPSGFEVLDAETSALVTTGRP